MRHKAIIAVAEDGAMVVDGTRCAEWPLFYRYGLLRPSGVSIASSNSLAALLGAITANDT
jgi:hypothetical protein